MTFAGGDVLRRPLAGMTELTTSPSARL